jgi:DNA-binding winged helix-turn-helix (wHTH) protein
MPLLFGDCVLDPDRRELKRASGAISIGPHVFDLLLIWSRTVRASSPRTT